MPVLIGLLLPAWLAAPVAVIVHRLTVVHVLCAEHASVIELPAGATYDSNPAATPSHEGEKHDHGCCFDGLAHTAIDEAGVRLHVAPLDVPEPDEPAVPGPRSTDLLHLAPKTSPPQA